MTRLSAVNSGIIPTERSNRSGRLAHITFHAFGRTNDLSPQASADTREELVVKNHGRAAAQFRVIAGPLHETREKDLTLIQAEGEEAMALASSSDRSTAALQQRLKWFKQAEDHWRSSEQDVDLLRTLAEEIYLDEFQLHNTEAALAQIPNALTLAEQVTLKSTVEAANTRKTAAFVYAQQAKYGDALVQYNEALRLFEQTADTYNRVTVLENRAKVERIEGQSELALADVETAIPLAQSINDATGELALEVERGAIASASGQLGTAYESDLRALSLAEKTPNPYLEGIAWSDLAVADTELQNFTEAEAALDHADAIWKKEHSLYGEIQTTDDRAELRLAQGDLPRARTSFSDGAKATKALPREHSYFLRGLAVTEMRSGQLADAQVHLQQAAEEAEHAHVSDTLSQIENSLGDLAAEQQHWTQGAAHWERAEAAAKQQSNHLNRAIALGGMVRAYLHAGQQTLASSTCSEAITELESVRGQIPDADLRLSFFASRHALYDLCVGVELRGGDPEAAFNTAERGRARFLLDQAAASVAGAGPSASLLAHIRDNDRLLAEARRTITAGKASRRRVADRPDVTALLHERELLRAQAAASGLIGRLASSSVPITQQELIRSLDPRTAVLAYWEGTERSCVWIVTARGASFHSLPSSSQLDRQIEDYLRPLLAPLETADASSAADRGRSLAEARMHSAQRGDALRRTLLPTAIPPSIQQLLLVKDGSISSVAFGALPLPKRSYLIDRYTLVTEPSASFVVRNGRPGRPFSKTRAVVFSVPLLAKTDAAESLSSLPFVQQEGRIVSDTFGRSATTVFAGQAASRANALRLDWSGYDIADFATHAVLRRAHPELSGLVLAADSTIPQAGTKTKTSLLSYFDILKIRVPLQLVVLDSCSSGDGKFVPGEGKMALDNAFLASGAASVMATLWPVDDEATAAFMKLFYKAMARTHSPAESLRESAREMARSQDWSDPSYWGAFTLSGEWSSLPD